MSDNRVDEITPAMRKAAESLNYDDAKPFVNTYTSDVPYRHSALGIPQVMTDARKPKVYVIQCGEFAKIGATYDMDQRFKQLDASTPHPIKLLKVMFGGWALERDLHARFAALHHKYEWFRYEGDLRDWVENGERP